VTFIDIFILCIFLVGMSLLWADIYRLREQIQTLRNENDLMIAEIQHNAKLLVEMHLKAHPVKIIPGKKCNVLV
jgi:hypothetical protein